MGKFKRPERADEKIEVGSWLINPGEHQTEPNDKIVYIDMDLLKPSANNRYHVGDLEKMADLIEMAGEILQSLVVKPADEDGMYEITTGERRWRGAQILKQRGTYPEKFQNKVPCIIRQPQKISLPLSEQSKEMFSILITNQYREKTDGDVFMEIQEWKKIFSELRRQHIEYISFSGDKETDQEGGKQGIQIKGVSTRDLVAQQIGLSNGQVGRFESAKKKASDRVLESLIANDLSLSDVEVIAGLPKELQDEMLDKKESGEAVSKEEVEEVKKKYDRKKILLQDEVGNDMNDIKDLVSEKVELSEEQYRKYKKCIQQIKKILEVKR